MAQHLRPLSRRSVCSQRSDQAPGAVSGLRTTPSRVIVSGLEGWAVEVAAEVTSDRSDSLISDLLVLFPLQNPPLPSDKDRLEEKKSGPTFIYPLARKTCPIGTKSLSPGPTCQRLTRQNCPTGSSIIDDPSFPRTSLKRSTLESTGLPRPPLRACPSLSLSFSISCQYLVPGPRRSVRCRRAGAWTRASVGLMRPAVNHLGFAFRPSPSPSANRVKH